MPFKVVPLTLAHLKHLPVPAGADTRAYFIPGSAAFCVLSEGKPVFAGGVVNLQWGRGEAWIIPTPFLRSHLKSAFSVMAEFVPYIAETFKFRRVQANCTAGLASSATLFRHLGFTYEGTLQKFGPNGEPCESYSRTFEVTP